MVPLFFEFCFIAALAALLIPAEQDIKRVMKAKGAMIATYRSEHLALETVSLLSVSEVRVTRFQKTLSPTWRLFDTGSGVTQTGNTLIA